MNKINDEDEKGIKRLKQQLGYCTPLVLNDTMVYQRRLVTLLHAWCCTNHTIHGRFNPVQPAESADHNLRTSKTIRTDVIRNVRSMTIQ